METTKTIVTGTVTKTNGKGFQLAEHDGWLNLSRWAETGTTLPSVGEQVTVTLDKSGFVRKIEHLAAPAPVPPTTDAPATATALTKDTLITRLAVLKAAADFLSTRPDAKSADVLKVAETWEAWVTRTA